MHRADLCLLLALALAGNRVIAARSLQSNRDAGIPATPGCYQVNNLVA